MTVQPVLEVRLPRGTPSTEQEWRELRDVDPVLYGKLQDHIARLADLQAAVPGISNWREQRRPEQAPPDGEWFVWLILAGRGWGKTRTGAEWAAEKGRAHPGCRVALVAATFADGRDTMVEGESGLLEVLDVRELRGGSVDTAWNRSLGELYLANGSQYKIYSAERARQLRGPQHHFGWADEVAQWGDADLGPVKDTAWSNLIFGLRLGARPQVCVTTTPKPVRLIRRRRPDDPPGLIEQQTTHTTRGRTAENLANLAPSYRANVIEPLVGTRLGRQELDAELLEEVEGALWTLDLISDNRHHGPVPALTRRAVSVDPSGSATGDECGIVAGGAAGRQVYLTHDRTTRGRPEERYRTACLLAHEIGAGVIVYEGNFGGDNIAAGIRAAWKTLVEDESTDVTGPAPRIEAKTARGSKADRAETAVQVYEQGRAHHCGDELALLEDEMTTWTPDSPWSPNRLDAAVHLIRWLEGRSASAGSVASPAGQVTPLRAARR